MTLEADESRSMFLVCDSCGLFVGEPPYDPEFEAVCDGCGSETLWAFATLERLRQYQADHFPEQLP